MSLDMIQKMIWNWGLNVFGSHNMLSRKMRAIRLVEEAIEFAHACDVPQEQIELAATIVYAKAPGPCYGELGDVLITSLAAVQTCGYSAEEILATCLPAIMTRDPAGERIRNEGKIAGGLHGEPRCTDCGMRAGILRRGIDMELRCDACDPQSKNGSLSAGASAC